MNASSFLVTPESRPAAKIRLICFPFAGGDITTYLPWLPLLDQRIELVIVQLPGRGRRSAEKPFSRMDLLVEELFGAMFSLLDKPFSFFGHSMGSKIAFELAKLLYSKGFPTPDHFFASGSASPCVPRRAAPIHRLPDSAFIARITKLSGVPQAVLDNQELMNFLLPMLRADFKLIETYVGRRDCVIPGSLTMLGGVDDVVVSTDELSKWSQHFQHSAATRLFQGGHFYLHSFVDDLVQTVNATLVAAHARQCA